MAAKVIDRQGRVRWVAPKRKAPITPTLDPLAIGRRVRAARLALGWSVSNLSRVAGVAVASVTKIEGGSRVPRTDIACRIALALRKTLDFVLLGRGARRRANEEHLERVPIRGTTCSETNG